jgi:general stress protein 26
MTAEALSDADQRFLSEAMEIAHSTIWCAMTTVDAHGRPRSRIVHPVWKMDGGRVTGWLTTRPTPLKSRHLANNPHVSLAYIAANTDFAYFDCTASWVDDPADKRKCWQAFLEAPEPVRYDPASIWPDGPTSENFAALRFTPYRIQWARAERIGRGEKPSLVRLAPTPNP